MTIKISANQLAEFITAKTPARRRQIVKQNKFGKGHPTYYPCFQTPAKEFLISGAQDATGILTAIDELKVRAKEHENSDWYATDCRITAEAFRALIKIAPLVRALNVTFAPLAAKPKKKLKFGDVEISITPNLIVHGERNKKPLVGALRFYLAKESTYQLGQRGAELVATLEFLWLTLVADGTRAPDTDLCMVLECQQQRITRAPADVAAQVKIIEQGCKQFVELWRLLGDKEAA